MTTLITVKPTGQPCWTRVADIGDYGGDEMKEDSTLEGTIPYAWTVYQMFQGNRGTAFTTDFDTLVHVEDLALARMFSYAFWRLPEKYVANSTPKRADEKLAYYVELLGVRRFPDESDRIVRRKCSAKWKIAKGPTRPNIDQGLQELLGDIYVGTTRTIRTALTDPPEVHYWAGGTAGDPSLDMGGGVWLSEYSHIGVTVRRPQAGEEQAFLRLMGTEFFDYMDSTLPAWCTFSWQADDGTGTAESFRLDISQLDYDGLTP